jgi:hypothetical protein
MCYVTCNNKELQNAMVINDCAVMSGITQWNSLSLKSMLRNR